MSDHPSEICASPMPYLVYFCNQPKGHEGEHGLIPKDATIQQLREALTQAEYELSVARQAHVHELSGLIGKLHRAEAALVAMTQELQGLLADWQGLRYEQCHDRLARVVAEKGQG